ncbi:hypothetical protein LTR36_000260 [Oleoguttula mirabilis]|uniref:Uncharacterized protein n=1 Tax=Oleoguttula mirabilis TaxID=1507867 RepID=A0AAV9JY17_9PEZI|nr:hypothetical protein LTR36_000260 [Oleoguttula mirabilis]
MLGQPLGIRQSVSHRRDRLFTSTTALILASKQVRAEYLEVVNELVLSPDWPGVVIEAQIEDMEFINLIGFTAILTPPERLSLEKKLLVKLAFSRDEAAQLGDGVGIWLDYCADVEMTARYAVHEDRGIGLDDEGCFVRSCRPVAGRRQRRAGSRMLSFQTEQRGQREDFFLRFQISQRHQREEDIPRAFKKAQRDQREDD